MSSVGKYALFYSSDKCFKMHQEICYRILNTVYFSRISLDLTTENNTDYEAILVLLVISVRFGAFYQNEMRRLLSTFPFLL